MIITLILLYRYISRNARKEWGAGRVLLEFEI